MPRTRWSPGRAGIAALSLVACVTIAPPARAADALGWSLDDESLRYDLRVEEAPEAPPRSPRLSSFMLVRQDDLRDGRTPTLSVEDPGDLLWYYLLALPATEAPRKGAPSLPIDDRFAVPGTQPRLVFQAKGSHTLRRKGARVAILTSVEVTCAEGKHWSTLARLEITRLFHTKRGLLEQAQFRIEVTSPVDAAAPDGASRADVWRGSVRPGQAIDAAAPGFHTDVQRGIERGAAWLLKQTHKRLNDYRKSTDSPSQALGRMALPCFALLRSGVDPRELRVEFEWMRLQPLKETYSVALWVMALEARSIQRTVRPPQAHTRSVARFARTPPAAADKALMAVALRWLLAARKSGEGWWSYYGPPPVPPGTRNRRGPPPPEGPLGHDGKTPATHGDRSNSQFAALALHSAQACGLEVPPEVWQELLDEALRTQVAAGPDVSLAGSEFGLGAPLRVDARDVRANETSERNQGTTAVERQAGKARGWGYSSHIGCQEHQAYGSMTAAGTSTVAVAREGLRLSGRLTGDADAKALAALRDGLCWLLRHYDVSRNPLRDAWYFYYAYSLEKAMDTAGIERLGPHEWYRELALELLARQDADGAFGDMEQTAFALLVLNRATLPVGLELSEVERVATGGRDPSLWDRVVVEGPSGEPVQLQLRQLLSVMAHSPEQASERLELARAALAALPEVDRPRLVPELSSLLEHAHRHTRRWAEESCQLLAGSMDPAALRGFVERWETLRLASESRDPGRIPAVRGVLTAASATAPLRREALTTLARLRAVEATEDVLSALEDPDPALREHAWSQLRSLAAPSLGFEPRAAAGARNDQLTALRAWWRREGPRVLDAELARRAVLDLSDPARAPAAAAELKRIGKPLALRPLVDGLRRNETRERAHALLTELSGTQLPADLGPWLDWLERQGL